MNFRRTRFRQTVGSLAITLVFASISSLGIAQLPKLGDETLVHTATAHHENYPSVAMDAAGNYVVCYTENGDITVRRFFRNGTPNGAAIYPVANTALTQADGSVAMADDGRFVVVWEDNRVRGGNNYDVMFALYNASGTLITSGQVNTIQSAVRENARVAMNRVTGEFVVTFAGGSSQMSVNVYKRRYSALGVALDASDVRVNTGGTDSTSAPSIAIASNGVYVIAWETDTDGNNIWEARFQRYNFNTGAAIGSNEIASQPTRDVTNVNVACDSSGNFVVVWVDGLPAHPAEPHDLLFRRYSSSGTALSVVPILLAPATYPNNGDVQAPRPRVAMANDQTFVVTYLHDDEIWARFFNASGVQLGDTIHVNTTTNPNVGEYQSKPGIAMNPTGNRATAVWMGTGAVDTGGVHKQRFAMPNIAPTFNPIADMTIDELQSLSFSATATESASNFGDTLTYSLVGAPAGATINAATGQFSWTPAEAQGPGVYPITFRVTDNGEPNLSAEVSATFTVSEVNQPPANLQLSHNIVVHGTPAGTTVGTLSATDTDLPAQTLTYSLVTGEGDADNSKFSISGNQLQLSTSPDINSQQTMSVRLRVQDTMGGAVEAPFTITVEPPANVGEWHLY